MKSPPTPAPASVALYNLNYWQFGDYLGLGAGAHGKLSFHDRILRQQKYRRPEDYMDRLLRPAQVGAQATEADATIQSCHRVAAGVAAR